MDLRQLNALLAVADQGSFTAAADVLATVQSNVSAHVARLEREVGAVLVEHLSPEAEDSALVGDITDMARDPCPGRCQRLRLGRGLGDTVGLEVAGGNSAFLGGQLAHEFPAHARPAASDNG